MYLLSGSLFSQNQTLFWPKTLLFDGFGMGELIDHIWASILIWG